MPLANLSNVLGGGIPVATGGVTPVSGPGSSTDNAIARWDGTAGNLIQNSVIIVADTTGAMSGWTTGAGLTLHGGGTITGASGAVTLSGGTSGTVILGATGGVTLSGTTTAKFGATAAATVGVSADTTGGVLTFTAPSAGSFAWVPSGGSNAMTLTGAGALTLTSGLTLGASSTILWTGRGFISSPADAKFTFGNTAVNAGAMIDASTADTFKFKNFAGNADAAITAGAVALSSTITTYNNIATVGNGVVSVQAAGRATAQVAANASISTYTVGAADASFLVSGNVNVTTATAHSFSMTCTYTDETNTSRTITLGFIQLTGGTFVTLITNVTGAGPYESQPLHIRCKASTAITFATTGTFTTVTYNAEGVVTKLA